MKETKKENYGTQLEFFAAFLLKKLFENLKGSEIKTNISSFIIDDFKIEGSPKGGEQLTDIPLTIYLKKENGDIRKLFLYIESKAYFAQKDVPEEDIISSVNNFLIKSENILKGYGDCYILFKPGNRNINKGGKLDSLLTRYIKTPNFLDYYFEISNNFFKKEEIIAICQRIKDITGNKKIRDDYENTAIEELCNNFFLSTDLGDLQKYLYNEMKLSIETFERSPKRKDVLLAEIRDIVVDTQAQINKEKIDVLIGFNILDPTMLDEYDKDQEIANDSLVEYISSKYRAFKVGYIFDEIDKYENKVSEVKMMKFIENKNPFKSIGGDYFDILIKYLDTFKNIDDDIVNELIRKDWSTTLGLFFYLGAREKCHIRYLNKEKLFTIGKK